MILFHFPREIGDEHEKTNAEEREKKRFYSKIYKLLFRLAKQERAQMKI